MQSILELTKTNKIILATFAFLVVLAFGSGRAHAATLNVSGGCTLEVAIDSVNAAANQSGCTATGAAYGTNDTINLPSGTITLTADLPIIVNKSLSVIGAGKGSTIIDANGHAGFFADPDPGPEGARDHEFIGLTITGAIPMAIATVFSGTTTLDSVEITDSALGAFLSAIHVNVKNSTITDNINAGTVGNLFGGEFGTEFAGLAVLIRAAGPTDIPSADVQDNIVSNNSAESAGLYIRSFFETNTGDADAIEVNIERTTVADNTAEKWGGIMIFEQGGTVSTAGTTFTMDSVTVSGNSVEVVTAVPLVDPFQSHIDIAGMIFNGNLANEQNITNLTSANNTVVNNLDDQVTIAGFMANLTADSADLTFTNATIVGNEATQADAGAFYNSFITSGNNPSFLVSHVAPFVPNLENGASAQNSLIAGNSRNGVNGSCAQGDKAAFGLSGPMDLTPLNLGNNITDDPFCTGYTVVPNILSTLGPLQDNGGPVETIALLPGSPAIAAGGAVLGVSTDARGIARSASHWDVGAYQTVLGDSTNGSGNGAANAAAPNTGAKTVSTMLAVMASVLGLPILGYAVKKRA